MFNGRLVVRLLLGPALCMLLLLGFSGPVRIADHPLAEPGRIAVALADEHEPGIPAGRPANPDYEPVQKAADDSRMAFITISVFAVPVLIWFIARALKPKKRSK